MPAPRLLVLFAAASALTVAVLTTAVAAHARVGSEPATTSPAGSSGSPAAPRLVAPPQDGATGSARPAAPPPGSTTAPALPLPAAPPPRSTTAPARPVAPATPAPTGWPALDAAIRRIPGSAGAAPALWKASGRYGHAGTTFWFDNTIYINPSVPPARLDSVVRHEWSHLLQARAYDGDIPVAVAALNTAFGPGPSGVGGVEKAADCMARQLGATWSYYTPCRDPAWQREAATLLAGSRL